jgi:flagella basal body P-ring formation protein FlgA
MTCLPAWRRAAAPLLALALAATAHAGQLEDTVRDYVQRQTGDLPGKVKLTIDPLDPAARLAPCRTLAASHPAGTRLWGKATVTVTCLGPAHWVVYVPVRVQVTGHYLRTNRQLAPGQPLGSDDFSLVEGDLTDLPAGTLTDPAQALGRPLRLGLGAGQPLRDAQLVTPLAVRQGQPVRLVARGSGFAVSSEGTALANAADGVTVAVRTASGQTVRGIARAGGVVEVSY